MALTDAVISTVVERLGDLLIEEVKLLKGVPGEVENISQQLRLMQSFLEDADNQQSGKKTIQSWIADARQLAYDAEDVLESYVHGVESRKKGGIKNILRRYVCILNKSVFLHKIGSEIQDIKARISRLDTLRQSYGIRAMTEVEASSSKRERELRRSYSHIDDEDFVGMEGDVKLLVELVVNDDVESENYHRALFICGMGGLGKTTLARKIYNHKDVRSHFNAFAWVCISQQWQTRDVLLDILTKLIPEQRQEIVNWNDEVLIKKIFEVQKERKCFLVLDDIWSKEAWDCIKAAFSTRKSGSKVLLTSRNEQVLWHVDSHGFLHEPKALDDKQSWELLEKKAFVQRAGPGINEITKKQELGREMVKSCKGVPLAIVALGGILAMKQTSSEWMMVQQNIKSCIASGEGMEGSHEGIRWILKLSYNDLPYRLKPCFVYLGKFPEDTDIDAENLYQLWMAENMLAKEDKRENESWMDVAERYLDQMAHRNMVMVKSNEIYESNRRYRSCRLHDLMRDLCVFKAKEEDFFKAIDFEHQNVDGSSSSSSSLVSSNSRKLVLYFGNKCSTRNCNFVADQRNCGRLRSLLIFFHGHEMSAKVVMDYVKGFKFLRVLLLEDLGYSGLNRDGDFDIPNLMHLRYLSLKGSRIRELPSSIANLEYLETLDLRVRDEIAWSSSTVLQNMRELLHLYLPSGVYRCRETVKVRLHGLLKLETIVNFGTDFCDINDLFELANLQTILKLTLRLGDLEDLDRLINNLQSNKFSQLRFSIFTIWLCFFNSEKGASILSKLLRCDRVNSLYFDHCVIPRLGGDQEVDNLGPSLFQLSMDENNFTDYKNFMDTMGKLPQLRFLRIFGVISYGFTDMVWSATSFPQLRELELAYLVLRTWTVEEGAMPCLARLRISRCDSLEMFPDGLRFLKSLRRMDVFGMPESVVDRVRVGGEDFDKVRHVPNIEQVVNTIQKSG